MLDLLSPEKIVARLAGSADWVGLRHVSETTTYRGIRNEHPDRNQSFIDAGVMIEVLVNGHFGYAATADVSREGIEKAFEQAIETTRSASRRKVFSFSAQERPKASGGYIGERKIPLSALKTADVVACLMAGSQAMKISDKIVNRSAQAIIVETQIDYYSSNGSATHQEFDIVSVDLQATAADGGDTQTRSMNGPVASVWQKGCEAFNLDYFKIQGEKVAREALELLAAPNCPVATTDLILMPDQMMLQIHESIGHPLELDRILGDERNYAGWSFVKPENFGTLKYGSSLMNVTFDPTKAGELASYAFDDGGNPATKEFLIKDGILVRGLGGLESQKRLKQPGVANFRASSWNRAPLDRMANINLEPGTSSLQEMVASVQKGILMSANRSWSIDDERNKFQFGCEYAIEIVDGQLGQTFKNPNYRGTTVSFWNSLVAVGNNDLSQTFGTPYCGKGEPNQVIRVGHASPPCLFKNVEVFGGGL